MSSPPLCLCVRLYAARLSVYLSVYMSVYLSTCPSRTALFTRPTNRYQREMMLSATHTTCTGHGWTNHAKYRLNITGNFLLWSGSRNTNCRNGSWRAVEGCLDPASYTFCVSYFWARTSPLCLNHSFLSLPASILPSIYLSICLSIYLSIDMCLCMSICLSVYPSLVYSQ